MNPSLKSICKMSFRPFRVETTFSEGRTCISVSCVGLIMTHGYNKSSHQM